MNNKFQIQIGPRWSVYTYQRPELRLIGTVQEGMQIGALAQAEDGNYLQVNGDVTRVLNKSRVEAALDRATGTRRGKVAPVVAPPPAAKPTVIVKKRRIVSAPAGS